MYSPDSRNVSYRSGVLILIGLWLAGLLLGTIISVPVWMGMTGTSALDMATQMNNPEHVSAVRVVQIVTTFFAFFVPAVLGVLIVNRRPFKFMGFNMPFDARQGVLALVVMFAAALVSGLLAKLTTYIPLSPAFRQQFEALEATYASQIEVIANMQNFGEYLIALVMIALLPAIFEEMFFRGAMQNLFQKIMRPWTAIILTSIVFSLIHFSFYGFLSRVCLGIVLGLIFYHSKNLWLSIIAHFFNNALALTQMYIYLGKGKSIREAMDETMPVWLGVLGLISLVFTMMLFIKHSNKVIKKHTPPEDTAREEKWIA